LVLLVQAGSTPELPVSAEQSVLVARAGSISELPVSAEQSVQAVRSGNIPELLEAPREQVVPALAGILALQESAEPVVSTAPAGIQMLPEWAGQRVVQVPRE
jgi:hypothetical protein